MLFAFSFLIFITSMIQIEPTTIASIKVMPSGSRLSRLVGFKGDRGTLSAGPVVTTRRPSGAISRV